MKQLPMDLKYFQLLLDVFRHGELVNSPGVECMRQFCVIQKPIEVLKNQSCQKLIGFENLGCLAKKPDLACMTRFYVIHKAVEV